MKANLETQRMYLRPVEDGDVATLTKWRGRKDYLEFVSNREQRNYHLQFMICLKENHRSIGIVYTFAFSRVNGFMFLNVFLDEKYRNNGYGAEASAIAICHIFDSFPVYKIYCDAFSSNIQSILMMKGAGLKQEGLLKGHRLYNGQRYDVARFAVHGYNLEKIRRLLDKFKQRGSKVG